MIAALAMYDFGPAIGANDRFWALVRDDLRAQGIAAPEALTRGDAAYWPAWESPDLLLSQTCGYPYRARLHDKVTLLGTPDYGLPGCPPGHYRSVYVVRRDDPRRTLSDFDGAGFAYNEDLSQSGWAGPQIHAASLGLRLHPVVQSGAHRLSARAVAEGRADIAAIDALTLEMMRGFDPVVAELREIGFTDPPTPGLPWITAKGRDPAPILAALTQAVPRLSPQDRATLRLNGVVPIATDTYLAMPNPPTPAELSLMQAAS